MNCIIRKWFWKFTNSLFDALNDERPVEID